MKDREIIDHFDCECGERHKLTAWATAHLAEGIEHTCDICSRVHAIYPHRVKFIGVRAVWSRSLIKVSGIRK